MKKTKLSLLTTFIIILSALLIFPIALKSAEASKDKPIVKKVVPKKVKQGETLDITIKGKRFEKEKGTSPKVKFSGKGITVNNVKFVSRKKLKANITVDSSAAKGRRTIKIINPNGKAGKKRKAVKIVKGSTPSSRSTVVFKNKSTYSGL
ncbi:MAG: hypothetical protein D6734_10195 [Candidatus Schekmanbacteria bacterium]|nr:MAG: hypothetical protein D6734_10195 [Candidatus Schekmanbacteria bacterium]